MTEAEPVLTIEGAVKNRLTLRVHDLAELDPRQQVADVSRLDPKRKGTAVRLSALLELAGTQPAATHLGLHSETDDFHASVPLAAVGDRGLVIYRLDGRPLDMKAGGPFRFLIPDYAACHSEEIDECANVKFVDRIELTVGKGFDNRPEDERAHAKLHGHGA